MIDYVIYRIPDHDDGTMWFRGHDYKDGVLQPQFREFTVNDGDSYLLMRFDHLMLAEKFEGGSYDRCRMAIDKQDGTPEVVHTLKFDELNAIAQACVASQSN